MDHIHQHNKDRKFVASNFLKFEYLSFVRIQNIDTNKYKCFKTCVQSFKNSHLKI